MEEKEIRPEQLVPGLTAREAGIQEPAPEHMLKRPERKKRKWIPWFLLAILICAGCYGLFRANRFALQIQLAGEPEILVEYGEVYQEPGASAVLSGKWLLSNGVVPENLQVEIQSDLETDKVGKYTVTYSAQYYGWTASAQRTVRITDSVCPIILLKSTGKTVLPGHEYVEEGYVALDNYDGNLTDKVRRKEENGVVTYVVMDSSGNPVSVERQIPYFDPQAPELILNGKQDITTACGTIYHEPGYSATDNADGEITDRVEVEGEVLWYQPGTYEVCYRVSDTFGNVSEQIRTVHVYAKERTPVSYPNGRVIYLTFDDGPGPHTGRLLDILKKYGVKATFFVTNSGYNGTLWRIVQEGHSIGVHTMTHDYNSIYSSEEAFFADLLGMQDIIYRNAGVKTTLMRFPGGGSNLVSNFNEGIMTRLTQAVQNAGFQYFDWNVDSNDAGGARTRETVAANVIERVQNQRISVVLQHDIHDFSVEAVEDIIVWGLENGYQFLPLKSHSPTMQHDVLN